MFIRGNKAYFVEMIHKIEMSGAKKAACIERDGFLWNCALK